MYNDPDLPHVRGHEDDASFVDGGDVEATGVTPRFGRLALCVAAASALALGVVGTVAYGVWFNSDQQTYAEAIARARQALRMPAPNSMATALAKSSAVPDTPIATSPQTALPFASVGQAPIMTSAMTPAMTPAITSAIGAPAPKRGMVTGSPTDTVALLDLPALPAESSAPAVAESRKPSVWSGQISRPEEEEELLADNAAAAPSSAPEAAVSPRSTQRSTAGTEPAAPQLASTRPAREAKYAQQERRASASSARRKGNLFARMGSFFRRVGYRQHGSGSQQDLYSHP